MRPRNGVKKRRFPDVWKTNNSGAKHDSVAAVFGPPKVSDAQRAPLQPRIRQRSCAGAP
jgi:hypothetical protein